jgi:hypothetical protein
MVPVSEVTGDRCQVSRGQTEEHYNHEVPSISVICYMFHMDMD